MIGLALQMLRADRAKYFAMILAVALSILHWSALALLCHAKTGESRHNFTMLGTRDRRA